MRIIRRFSHYNVGEVIAVSLEQGRDLDARRLAAPLDILVPSPASPPAEPASQRQPGATVRK